MDKEVAAIKAWLRAGSVNILGPVLSGKDTQGKRLAKLLDGVLIGGGDIIRNSERSDIKDIIDQGELAPSDEFIKLVTPYFSKEDLIGKPLILSAIGRWQGEETKVVKAAEASGHPLQAVIFIELPEAEVKKRLKARKQEAGRKDDSEEAFTVRLKEYQEKTLPVIDYYKQRGILIPVNGNQPPDKVTQEIITKLYELVPKEDSPYESA